MTGQTDPAAIARELASRREQREGVVLGAGARVGNKPNSGSDLSKPGLIERLGCHPLFISSGAPMAWHANEQLPSCVHGWAGRAPGPTGSSSKRARGAAASSSATGARSGAGRSGVCPGLRAVHAEPYVRILRTVNIVCYYVRLLHMGTPEPSTPATRQSCIRQSFPPLPPLHLTRAPISLRGCSVNVCDTVGCGDSLAAALVLGRLRGLDLGPCLRLANAVGAATAMGKCFRAWLASRACCCASSRRAGPAMLARCC